MEGKEIIENMTKGECGYHYFSSPKLKHRYIIQVSGTTVCKIGRDDNDNSEQEKANVSLICEAFNVANQTGLTPSQLHSELEKAKELLNQKDKEIIMLEKAIRELKGGTNQDDRRNF